jgi:hypothetical protein
MHIKESQSPESVVKEIRRQTRRRFYSRGHSSQIAGSGSRFASRANVSSGVEQQFISFFQPENLLTPCACELIIPVPHHPAHYFLNLNLSNQLLNILK